MSEFDQPPDRRSGPRAGGPGGARPTIAFLAVLLAVVPWIPTLGRGSRLADHFRHVPTWLWLLAPSVLVTTVAGRTVLTALRAHRAAPARDPALHPLKYAIPLLAVTSAVFVDVVAAGIGLRRATGTSWGSAAQQSFKAASVLGLALTGAVAIVLKIRKQWAEEHPLLVGPAYDERLDTLIQAIQERAPGSLQRFISLLRERSKRWHSEREHLIDQICCQLRAIQSADAVSVGNSADLQYALAAELAAAPPGTSGTGFTGRVNLRGAQLHDLELAACRIGSVDCASAVFHGATTMADTVFEGRAFLSSARFTGQASFDRVRFESSSIFDSCCFQGPATFRDAVFGQRASFRGATFHAELELPRSAEVDLTDAVLHGFRPGRYALPNEWRVRRDATDRSVGRVVPATRGRRMDRAVRGAG